MQIRNVYPLFICANQCFAIFSYRQKNRDNPWDHLEIESFKQVFQDQDRLENRERGFRNIEIESESAF